ncbi:MAG: CpaF family protein [Candidatus Omnitrophica bacterium]|nr:CpaF family protein [Candidatus Omnitrophota bacterium]MDD5652780.1 CpaF family protein [Candidatus Omnitrophota bacterium]
MDKILKDKVRKKLIAEYNELFSRPTMDEAALKTAFDEILNDIAKEEHIYTSDQDRKVLMTEILIEFTGLGIIDALLSDPTVTEIMINGPKRVYLERNGKKELAQLSFDDEQQLNRLISKILMPTRRHVDEAVPFTDVSLKDGSRVNIIIPPLAVDGAIITIRKFLSEIRSMEDLLGRGTLDKRMADFLIASMRARLNLVVAGATGSGKTTTLGVLSTYIDKDERIITIEDTPELHLYQDHVVRLETRQPNIEGKGEITTRDLFKNSLRMRPERIILGEIRGGETLDMLQAICSGHTGSLAVMHGNTPQDVIYRMETMILTSGVPITLDAVHRQIAAAIHLIVQQDQLLDGTRRITHIAQINGLKDGQVVLEDIFVYDIESVEDGKVKGKWRATGVIPVFYPLFKKAGIDLAKEIFNAG